MPDPSFHRHYPGICPRRLRLGADDRSRRGWLGGDVAKTALWDAFSVFLPCGERFFVRSVRHYREAVADPQLRHDIDAFAAQEAMHAGAHHAWNSGLAAQGHDVSRLEAPAVQVLTWLTTKRPPLAHLAVTCALEHVTAIVADALLRDPALLRNADPRHAALWFWHALEETEHKAVAFDVLTAVVRSRPRWTRYGMRTRVFLEATLVFNVVLLLNIRRLIAGDPWTRRLMSWLSISWYLWGTPGLYRRCFLNYCRYLRPGFHPWQHDNRDMLEPWRRRLDDVAVATS